MQSRDNRGKKVAQVARQMGAELRKQARKSWTGVVTAERNEGDRHVWRFRSPADGSERFLHLPHREMVQGDSATLLQQLEAGRWTDQLSSGSGNAVILSQGGLQAYPVN
jgi:hypothetical protein